MNEANLSAFNKEVVRDPTPPSDVSGGVALGEESWTGDRATPSGRVSQEVCLAGAKGKASRRFALLVWS